VCPAFEMTTSCPRPFFLAVNERQTLSSRPMLTVPHQRLVVHPLARRRGIRGAAGGEYFEFRRRGVKHVDLKVQVDNPTGQSACIKNWECEK